MTDRLIQYDGLKMASIWGGIEDGWVISGSPDEQTKDVADLFRAIPWMFRGTTLRADAIMRMPFALVKGTEDYDVSTDWQNKVAFLPDLPSLLWLVEASLVLTGKAYLWKELNALAVKSISYKAPQSITYEVKPDGKIVWKRDLGDGRGPQEVKDPQSIIHFWLHDPFVEKGSAQAYPGAAALSAAGVLFNMDAFVAAFFKRGAIKATIFQAEGMNADDRKEFLTWWTKLVTGIRNAFTTKIVNAKNMVPVVIGEGIDSLQNVTLTDDKKKDIASAFGIPFAILFSDAANYATAQQDDLNFLDKTIVPECRFIESVLNEQLFTPLDLRFEFREETLDAYQADESDRATSLKSLTDAGVPLLMAMDILGYELSDEQRKELEAAEAEKKRKEEEMANALANAPKPAPGQPGQRQALERGAEAVGKSWQEELDKWERKALKALRAGKSPAVDFDSDIIPGVVSADIELSLSEAKSETDIKAAFAPVKAKDAPAPDGIAALIAELREARAAVMGERE